MGLTGDIQEAQLTAEISELILRLTPLGTCLFPVFLQKLIRCRFIGRITLETRRAYQLKRARVEDKASLLTEFSRKQ